MRAHAFALGSQGEVEEQGETPRPVEQGARCAGRRPGVGGLNQPARDPAPFPSGRPAPGETRCPECVKLVELDHARALEAG